MRRNVFSLYFAALAEGDPVALAATGVFALFLFVVGLVAWRYKVDERREQERKQKRWSGRE